jgi:hypothetical protein
VVRLGPQAVVGGGVWDASDDGLSKARLIGRYLYRLAALNYEVEVQSSQPILNQTKIKIELVGPDGKRAPNRQALYPHELLPCAEK